MNIPLVQVRTTDLIFLPLLALVSTTFFALFSTSVIQQLWQLVTPVTTTTYTPPHTNWITAISQIHFVVYKHLEQLLTR